MNTEQHKDYGRKCWVFPAKTTTSSLYGAVNHHAIPDFDTKPREGIFLAVVRKKVDRIFRYRGFNGNIKSETSGEWSDFAYVLFNGEPELHEMKYVSFRMPESTHQMIYKNNGLMEMVDYMIRSSKGEIERDVETRIDSSFWMLEDKIKAIEKKIDDSIDFFWLINSERHCSMRSIFGNTYFLSPEETTELFLSEKYRVK